MYIFLDTSPFGFMKHCTDKSWLPAPSKKYSAVLLSTKKKWVIDAKITPQPAQFNNYLGKHLVVCSEGVTRG